MTVKAWWFPGRIRWSAEGCLTGLRRRGRKIFYLNNTGNCVMIKHRHLMKGRVNGYGNDNDTEDSGRCGRT